MPLQGSSLETAYNAPPTHSTPFTADSGGFYQQIGSKSVGGRSRKIKGKKGSKGTKGKRISFRFRGGVKRKPENDSNKVSEKKAKNSSKSREEYAQPPESIQKAVDEIFNKSFTKSK